MSRKLGAWLGWADNGPPGKYVAWVFKGWLGFKIGGHSGNLVGNYVVGSTVRNRIQVWWVTVILVSWVYGGQVKCAQLHCSNSNICWPLRNDDIVQCFPCCQRLKYFKFMVPSIPKRSCCSERKGKCYLMTDIISGMDLAP